VLFFLSRLLLFMWGCRYGKVKVVFVSLKRVRAGLERDEMR
jgi:hypothetical protein